MMASRASRPARISSSTADDFLTRAHGARTRPPPTSAALWFNVSPLSSGDRYLLQQTDSGGGSGPTLALVSGSLGAGVRSFLGGSTLEHPTKITPTPGVTPR
ncbi:MAG: hypothetical protein R3A44_00045 [Caldilineaceae bacterium]